jgi:hypothetical protein
MTFVALSDHGNVTSHAVHVFSSRAYSLVRRHPDAHVSPGPSGCLSLSNLRASRLWDVFLERSGRATRGRLVPPSVRTVSGHPGPHLHGEGGDFHERHDVDRAVPHARATRTSPSTTRTGTRRTHSASGTAASSRAKRNGSTRRQGGASSARTRGARQIRHTALCT